MMIDEELIEQTSGIVELISRSQGHFCRSAVEAKWPGDEVVFAGKN
jgi:hypothetical protein